MEIPFYQVDAFANAIFAGNPAAVMVMEHWLSERQMQAIAAEMNLSETVFVVPDASRTADFDIRWFTPTAEVELCGHATLASVHVLKQHLNDERDTITFNSRSGILSTRYREDGLIELDFPAARLEPQPITDALVRALGITPIEVLGNPTRLLVKLASAEQLANLEPDMRALEALPQYGICCTAEGSGFYDDIDFVCRFFAPAQGIPEDPVTGSAYTALVPYYAQKTGRTTFLARQISQRGGELQLALEGERVKIAGPAVTVIHGTFYLPDALSS